MILDKLITKNYNFGLFMFNLLKIVFISLKIYLGNVIDREKYKKFKE